MMKDYGVDEKDIRLCKIPGEDEEVELVSLSGLYKLASASQNPKAKEFINWIEKEILPNIKKGK